MPPDSHFAQQRQMRAFAQWAAMHKGTGRLIVRSTMTTTAKRPTMPSLLADHAPTRRYARFMSTSLLLTLP